MTPQRLEELRQPGQPSIEQMAEALAEIDRLLAARAEDAATIERLKQQLAAEWPDLDLGPDPTAEQAAALKRDYDEWMTARHTKDQQLAAKDQRIAALEGALRPFANAVEFETGNPDAYDSFSDHVTDEQWLRACRALAPAPQAGTAGTEAGL